MADFPYSGFNAFTPGFNYTPSFKVPTNQIDWNNLSKVKFDATSFASPSSALSSASPVPQTPQIAADNTGNVTTAAGGAAQADIAYLQQVTPYMNQWRDQMMNDTLRYNQASLNQVYPYLDAMQTNMINKNLQASEKFYNLKQQSPAGVQAIMESKQGQIDSAADAEYRRAMGTAAQQEAATNFARRYAGQTFSTA